MLAVLPAGHALTWWTCIDHAFGGSCLLCDLHHLHRGACVKRHFTNAKGAVVVAQGVHQLTAGTPGEAVRDLVNHIMTARIGSAGDGVIY